MAALAQSTENTTAESHTTASVAERYRNIIDWKRWFLIVNYLGNQCNSHKMRMDKGDMLEKAIEICSNKKLIWVDKIGRDHHDVELNLDIEFKFQEDCMFTKVRKKETKHTNIKIKNSLGKTKTTKIEDPADYYLFAQQDAVGIISYAEMLPHLKIVADGLSTMIPAGKITYIITPQNEMFKSQKKTSITNSKCMNYKEKKQALQLEFIMSIPPSSGFQTTEDTPEVHLSDLEHAKLLAVIAASEAEHNYSNAKSETSE